MEEFIEEFKVEAGALTESLISSLMFYESNTEQKEIVEEIFRVMHTLKGSARMFGFENIEKLTHQLENVYNDVRNSSQEVNPAVISLSLEVADCITEIIKGVDDLQKQERLLEQINNVQTFVVKQIPKTFYVVYYQPNKDIYNRGINPQAVFEELEEVATIISFRHGEDISLEVQKENKEFISRYEIWVALEGEYEELEDVFMFFNDNEYTIHDLLEVNDELRNNITLFANQELTDESWNERLTFYEEQKASGVQISEEVVLEDNVTEEEVDSTSQPISSQPKVDKLSYINVNLNKLDEMLYLLSELVSVKAELTYSANALKDKNLLSSVEKLEKITNRFRDNAFSVRLVPIQVLSVKFQRHIRDLCASLGKEVVFTTEGMDTEIDKAIINEVEAPLMHIIRNALDHGIETPEERLQKNKKEEGLIKMVSFYSGANVFIQVQDDGRGLDLERIRKKAISKGWAKESDYLTEKEIIDFIFRPGFTTEDNISEYSGRGVGMDVVRESVRSLRGNIDVTTEKDLGTSFTLRLPLSLSILDVMHIAHGGVQYLVPKSEILQCVSEAYHSDIVLRSGYNLKYEGELIPLISLDDLSTTKENSDIQKSIIIINKNDQKVAIEVEDIVGEDQVVVKPVDDALSSIDYLGGVSVMGNGDLAFVLDALKLRDSYSANRV